MKIAVSAESPSLDAAIDARFGRCPYFLIIETDDTSFEAVENTNSMLVNGAGIQSAQLIAEKGARYVLTGKCGPNSRQALSAAGIMVITDCSGTVRNAVERFKTGKLKATDPADPGSGSRGGMGVNSSGNLFQSRLFGGGSGRGMGRGGGRGGGMGGCRAGGMGGRGRGMAGLTGVYMDENMASYLQQEPGTTDSIEDLKSRAESLKQQLEDIQRKIDAMERR